MKALITFLFFSALHNGVFSQVDTVTKKYLNNDSIRYFIVTKSSRARSFTERTPTMEYVGIEMNLKTYNSFLKRSEDFWLSHLRDSSSDWATNLVLYNLYKRDAFIIKHGIKDRNKWMPLKEDDINYWTHFLDSVKNVNSPRYPRR